MIVYKNGIPVKLARKVGSLALGFLTTSDIFTHTTDICFVIFLMLH